VSEYQYYEFRAIDRPLTTAERTELRKITTRAEITATSLTNSYQWGSFKGNPDALMDRYFDAFVYVSNWGTRRFMLRVPRRSIDLDAASEYADGEVLSIRAGKEHVVLDFHVSLDEPEDDWDDGEAWMGSLVTLRNDLLRGDLRALYVGWLAAISEGDWDEDQDDDRLEPPVPPGMARMSGPLLSLAQFLWVDDELLEVAAKGSTGDAPAGPSRVELEKWVKGLPVKEKDAYLARFLADDEGISPRTELIARFRESSKPRGPRPDSDESRRTVAELNAMRDELVVRKAAEEAAEEAARRARELAKAREARLNVLAKNEGSAWKEVDRLIAEKNASGYDQAVSLLDELRQLADRSGRRSEVEARIRDLRLAHAKKSTLIQRLNKNKLGL